MLLTARTLVKIYTNDVTINKSVSVNVENKYVNIFKGLLVAENKLTYTTGA